jgi:hypothetical protein
MRRRGENAERRGLLKGTNCRRREIPKGAKAEGAKGRVQGVSILESDSDPLNLNWRQFAPFGILALFSPSQA